MAEPYLSELRVLTGGWSDADGRLDTTDDRLFNLDSLLAGELDDALFITLDAEANAVLRGIKINSGIGGIPIGHGAEFHFFVENLTRAKAETDYIKVQFRNLPGIFQIHKILKIEDLVSALIRARNYVLQALDQLPFWVTDPNRRAAARKSLQLRALFSR